MIEFIINNQTIARSTTRQLVASSEVSKVVVVDRDRDVFCSFDLTLVFCVDVLLECAQCSCALYLYFLIISVFPPRIFSAKDKIVHRGRGAAAGSTQCFKFP